MKQRVESYVWHDAKKHKPPTFGQYLVADDTTEGFMWVAEWDYVLHPDTKHGYWSCSADFDQYKITHWAGIAPPTINKQFQWTNIHDPLPSIKAPSLLKSNSQKKNLTTSTP